MPKSKFLIASLLKIQITILASGAKKNSDHYLGKWSEKIHKFFREKLKDTSFVKMEIE